MTGPVPRGSSRAGPAPAPAPPLCFCDSLEQQSMAGSTRLPRPQPLLKTGQGGRSGAGLGAASGVGRWEGRVPGPEEVSLTLACQGYLLMHGDRVTGTLLGVGDRHSYAWDCPEVTFCISESERAAGFGDDCLCHSSWQKEGQTVPQGIGPMGHEDPLSGRLVCSLPTRSSRYVQ